MRSCARASTSQLARARIHEPAACLIGQLGRSKTPQDRSFPGWNLCLGALVFVVWAVAAVWFRADLDLLLALATMLWGVGAFATFLREWSLGRASSAFTLAGCAAGILFMLSVDLQLMTVPTGIGTMGLC